MINVKLTVEELVTVLWALEEKIESDKNNIIDLLRSGTDDDIFDARTTARNFPRRVELHKRLEKQYDDYLVSM